MKKKILFFICFLAFLFSTQRFSLNASAAMTEDRFEYEIENNTVTIVRYKGRDRVVIIPESIQNMPVTKIGSYAFWYDPKEEEERQEAEEKVELELQEQEKQPNQEIELAEDPALYANHITEIRLPSSLQYIDNMAFFSCSDITSIQIPEGVHTIEAYAFLKCSSLQQVGLPSTLTKLGNGAFEDCYSLRSITIPSHIKTIGYYTFFNCKNLSSVSLPAGLEVIQSSAFEKCSGLGSIVFPSNLEKIMTDAFLDCDSLRSVDLPLKMNLLANHAFGYKEDSDGGFYKISDFKIHCHKDTIPYVYAVKNGFSGNVAQHSNNKKTTKASLTVSGKIKTTCSVCGYSTTQTIYYPKTIAFKSATTPFTGGVTKPALVVKDSRGTTISSANYTVKNTTNCTSVGKHSVKITFKGNYSGTISKTYTILPKPVQITKLSALVKGFTINWAKGAAQTTGYQLQFSRNKSFASPSVLKTYTGTASVYKKITGLKAKSLYYVRVRTFKTVNGAKYYSAWSAVKSFTTK